jgi:hypothetical protein
MKRLKVSHKGTHKIAHLQKGARHSFARTKRTRKKAPACLKQIAATPALPLRDTSTPRTFISVPVVSALPHPSGTARRRRRVRQQRTYPNSWPANDAPPTAGAAHPQETRAGRFRGRILPPRRRIWKKMEKGHKSRSPRVSARALLKEGGDLLSSIAVQYHRRARA